MSVHRTTRELFSSFAQSWLGRYGSSFSFWGLVIGAIFFAASLTPSLLPRHFAVQGILSGLAFAVGYGVGVLGVWVWRYLELGQRRAPAVAGLLFTRCHQLLQRHCCTEATKLARRAIRST